MFRRMFSAETTHPGLVVIVTAPNQLHTTGGQHKVRLTLFCLSADHTQE